MFVRRSIILPIMYSIPHLPTLGNCMTEHCQLYVISYQTLVYVICITTQTYTHLHSMKTAAGAASPSIYLCNNKGNSVSVTPVSCQIKILVSVCHLPENFCTLSMTRSILTVPFAFLINVSSLILSWLLILPFPTHCTKVKDTVQYYTVTYMLLIWRRLNDLFSYKNIVNSNSQYLALRHVLFIYRDGTMALARTSGQVLANPDNMAVFCSGRKQLELQKTLQLYVYLQIHQPMADRKREW